MKKVLLLLALLCSPALAQNPGVTTQGSVTANNCVKFVNRNLIADAGAACGGGGGGTPANPTAVVGLTTVNGVLATYMRSDAAPPLDQTAAFKFTGLDDTVIAAGKSLTVDTNTLFVDGANHKAIVTGGSGADYAFTVKATSAGNVAAKQYNSSSSGFAGIDMYEANGTTYKAGFGYGNSASGAPYQGVAYVDTNAGVDFLLFMHGAEAFRASGTNIYALQFTSRIGGGVPVKQYNTNANGFGGTDIYEANGTTFVGSFGYGNSGSGAPYANNVYIIGANKDFVVFGGAGATETLRVSNAGALKLTQTGGVTFTNPAAATLQLGAANAAVPVNQTAQSQGSRAGTDTNVSGSNFTVASGQGTGNSAGSSLLLQSPVAVASGTGAQTMTTGLSINGGTAITTGYAVAALPAAATAGARAHVTDALNAAACVFFGAIVAGGTTVCPVFYNGAAWVGG